MNLYCNDCSRGWEDDVYGFMCPDCGRNKCLDCGGHGITYSLAFSEEDPLEVLKMPTTGVIEDCPMCGGTGNA